MGHSLHGGGDLRRQISAALATTVGVLTEVPVMLFLVKIANKTKGRFPV